MSPQDHSHANLPAVSHTNGVDAYRASTDAAGVCGAIVKATAIKIQGRKYVQIEGWQAIAIAHGCIVSARDVEKIEGGFRAIGEVRRMSDGALLATAEGFLGDDESTWAKRPMFARRAFVQTRAMSRACRSAFAHVVVMIDKDLGTTPAEEMQGVYENEPSDVQPQGWAGSNGNVDPADRGLTENAPKFTSGQLTRMQNWLKGAMGTLQLTGHTTESLDAFRRDNEPKYTWLEKNMPEEYEALDKLHMNARDAAEARAA